MLRVIREKLLDITKGNRIYATLLVVAILGLAIYGISNIARGFYSVSITTEQIVLGSMVNAAEKNIVIVRDEQPIYASSSGIVSYVYNEGEKARENATVAEVRGSEVADSYKYRLKIIDAKISEVMNNQVPVQSSQDELATINQRLDYLYAEVQNRLFTEDMSYVESIKDEIIMLNDKKRFIEENGSGVARSLEELESEKQEILENLKMSNSRVVAPITGLVVPYADGYESELSLDNMKNLTVTDLEKYKDKSVVNLKGAVNAGDPIGKMVKNDKWYIVCEVDKDDIQSIATESKMNIYIEDTKIAAYLENFEKGSDGKFIGFFRVETEGFKFYEKRNFPARLEYKYSEGILVPKHAITKNEAGRIGVFALDEANAAKFKLVENIISEDENNYICKNEKSNTVVSLYDKIISDPNGIKEGQKVVR